MDEWIVASRDVLGGKPCVKGTRLSVEFLMELLAEGSTRDAILESYPQLTLEGLAAAIGYAARAVSNETVWEVQVQG